MSDGVLEMVENTDVVAQVSSQEIGAFLDVLDVTSIDPRTFVVERAANDCLDDILNPGVDRGYAFGEPAKRDRMNPFEATDLEHMLVGKVEAFVEETDPSIGNRLRCDTLAVPRRPAEWAPSAIDGKAVPREELVQPLEILVCQLLDK